jgi:hypothetical protein
VTDQTLESILAKEPIAEAPAPIPDADEKETSSISDPVENKIGTDQVEGESPDDPTKEAQPDKVGAAFKGVREGERKRYTEAITDFEKKLEAQNAAWQARFDQLTAALTPQRPAEAPPDFFENPQGAVRAELEPVLQAQAAQREQFSLMMAAEKHGEQTVQEAFQWLSAKKAANPQAFQADYARVMSAPHPYGELVKAYKQSQVLSEIGDDPVSYRDKLKAELLAELQANGSSPAVPGARPATPAAMPSNFADARSAAPRDATWTGPPSLKDIFSKG